MLKMVVLFILQIWEIRIVIINLYIFDDEIYKNYQLSIKLRTVIQYVRKFRSFLYTIGKSHRRFYYIYSQYNIVKMPSKKWRYTSQE